MSKISGALIEEYLSERNEALENEKLKLGWLQVWCGIGGVQIILMRVIQMYAYSWLIAFIVIAVCANETFISYIQNASASEILKGVSTLHMLVWSLTVIGIMVFCFLRSRTIFRNSKNERLDLENQQAENINNIVLVCEELLIRHKLIQNEENTL